MLTQTILCDNCEEYLVSEYLTLLTDDNDEDGGAHFCNYWCLRAWVQHKCETELNRPSDN